MEHWADIEGKNDLGQYDILYKPYARHARLQHAVRRERKYDLT